MHPQISLTLGLTRSGRHFLRVLAVSLLTIGILAFAPRMIHAQGGPKTLVNAEWVIKHGEGYFETFSSDGATFQASVAGVKNADIGFRVRVVNAQDAKSCTVEGGTCRELTSWTQPRTRAFTQTAIIPPGHWAFLVENSENIFKTMTVLVNLTEN